jgi:predicted permease
MDSLLQDLRYAVRSLRRTPGFTLTVVAMLALGIGVNAMIYSLMRAILFTDLPFADPERVVSIATYDKRENGRGETMSMPDARDVRDQSKTLAAVGLWSDTDLLLAGGDAPQRVHATFGSDGLIATLGVQPHLGRWFTPDECRVGASYGPVVIGARVWRERLNSDPNVIGRTLALHGRVRTIVGVMPEGFRFPEASEVYIPLAMNDSSESRGAHYLKMAARLAPGATLAAARAELAQISGAIAKDNPSTNRNQVFRPVLMREALVGETRPMLLLLAIAVTFVLMIACANVANLLLARGSSRVRELGVRHALGATRGRVVRQLLAESVLLALMGGLLGVVVGEWGLRLTLAGIPQAIPYWMHFQLDPRVVAIVVAVSVASGIGFGLVPAWQVTSGDILSPLREGTPGAGSTPVRRRMRSALVVAEVALAVVLLVGSGLMVRSFLHMQDQRSALRTEHVLTGTVALPYALYPKEEQTFAFFEEYRHALASLPGVRAVGGVLHLHLGNDAWTVSVQRDGIDANGSPDSPIVSLNVITPGYLATVGMPLLKGRDFTDADGAPGANAVLLNRSAARKLWPNEDPIGKRLRLSPDYEWATVVGIVADVRQQVSAPEQSIPEMLVPHRQWRSSAMTWAIRTDGAPTALASAMRNVLRARDPNLALYDLRSMREQIARSMWDSRIFAQLMSVFSLLALLIAALGIYGVMAYTVAQRTREIGIRMALGAARADVQKLVVGQALRLTLIGAGIGLAAAFALTRFMEGMLFGIHANDPTTFVGVTLILVLSSAAAAWLPTASAVSVDPVVALRHE